MAWIRDHYAERLDFKAVAALAGMSVSVFYDRFKAVAAVSPLQYQKYIRLHEARRRMIANQAGAAEVAFAVGYESASQFSREYKRLFGAPPGQDTKRAKAGLGASIRQKHPVRGQRLLEPLTVVLTDRCDDTRS